MGREYDVINKITGEVLSGDYCLDRNQALIYAAKWADANSYDSIEIIDNPKRSDIKPYVYVSVKNYKKGGK